MARDAAPSGESTRRSYLQYGLAIVGGGLLAGCSSGSGSSGSNASNGSDAAAGTATEPSAGIDTEAGTASGTERTAEAGTPSETAGTSSYTVTIEPNDLYTFQEVPETYGVVSGPMLDIGMSLGIHPSATTGLERAPTKFYDLLELGFDGSQVTKLASDAESGYDKENFYAADCDVWLIARSTLESFTDWGESDFQEIQSQTGPFLGTSLRFAPTIAFSEEPNPYTLYEAFEKVAKVFQRQRRFRAWQSFHDDLMSTVNDGLPPEGDRPTVAAIWRGVSPDSGQFRIAPLHRLGNNTKSYYRLGMQDAFEGRYPDGPIGYEELLSVDPDYIGAVGALTSSTHEQFVSEVVEPFENNENGQQLSAVQNGNVIRSAGQYMGPIVDMFSTEAVAKMVYPDTFGAWPSPVGELSAGQRLFDRTRLVDIVDGNL